MKLTFWDECRHICNYSSESRNFVVMNFLIFYELRKTWHIFTVDVFMFHFIWYIYNTRQFYNQQNGLVQNKCPSVGQSREIGTSSVDKK